MRRNRTSLKSYQVISLSKSPFFPIFLLCHCKLNMNNRLMKCLPFFILISLAPAIRVTPNSPCTKICLSNGSDPSNTSSSDIVCTDSGFSKAIGQKFAACVDCLQKSTFSNADESDQEWLFCEFFYYST
jgi:hypothetical protein